MWPDLRRPLLVWLVVEAWASQSTRCCRLCWPGSTAEERHHAAAPALHNINNTLPDWHSKRSDIPHKKCRRATHLPFLGLEPVGDIPLKSEMPDLLLPSQPQGITASLPVPNYTTWWQRHMRANNLPKVATWKQNSRDSNPRPFESQVQRSRIMPPGHTYIVEMFSGIRDTAEERGSVQPGKLSFG